jgi:DNA-binding response OmpR family regulator
LDPQLFQVTIDDISPRTIELTRGETAVLAGFMSQPDRTLTCGELVTAAWDYEADEVEAESVIRPYIFRLRRKIELDGSSPAFIRTVRGKGYVLQTDA